MRAFLVRAIKRAGYGVVAVDRGTAALAHIEAGGFDLLLTDVVMPGMDGLELARRVATLAPGMRVMFITGFSAVALDRGMGAPTGAKILSKPFHLRDLVVEIERLLAEPQTTPS